MVEPVVAVTGTGSRRALILLLVGVLVATVAPSAGTAAAPSAGKKGKTYEAPYKPGPQGGDFANLILADPDMGSMAILRLFPGIPPVVGCEPEPSAGWAMFRVKHTVKAPVRKVKLDFDAALAGYGWITVGARDRQGGWLGVKKLQGPHAGAGTITARLFDRPSRGETITIEFGVQLGDACPQVEPGAATFNSVSVI
ncbi:MAG TPA: hypothetical protein VFS18_04795 [Actinomycetota bacterium]|nr:hypothetical protein [Actinomycetota bacterium]